VNQLLLIALGSALGGALRYLLSQGVHLILGRDYPYGTLSVNLLGCFCMGLLFVLLKEKHPHLTQSLKPFLLIGLLGGFTTFSAFAIETLNLFENYQLLKALGNVLLTTIGCLAITWLGLWCGRMLWHS